MALAAIPTQYILLTLDSGIGIFVMQVVEFRSCIIGS